MVEERIAGLSVLLLGVILCVPVQADAIQSHPNAAALVRAFAVEPAGDFEPTGIDSDDYLRLIAGNVDYFRQHQAESGAIIDPVSKGERQYSTPAFALAAGVLAAEAGRDDLLEPAAAAMSHALGALVEGRAADGHPDFYAPLLVHAFRVLEGEVPEARAQAWGRQFERIEPESIYRMDLRRMNWNVVSSSGELLRRHDGLVAPDRREAQMAYLEESLAGHMELLTPLGLFHDPGAPMAYDAFSRLWLEDALADDAYDGEHAAKIERFLRAGGLSTLLLLSPSGEWPGGGRSALHQWNEAQIVAICEMNARRWKADGRDDVAAAFKRAARLAFASMARWQRPSGELWIVKNRGEPESRLGFERYSHHSQYNLLAMAMLAIAHARADESIAERPTPAEVGGYVFDARETFHKVVAAAGGYQVLIDTAADPHYNATGLQRVHRAGVAFPALNDTAAAERAYAPHDAPRLAIAPGLAWRTGDGAWIGLADFAGGDADRRVVRVDLDVAGASPDDVRFTLDYQLSNGGSDAVVTETYQLGSQGVTLTAATDAGGPRQGLLPVLVNDGLSDTEVVTRGGTVEIVQRGSATRVTFEDPAGECRLGDEATVTHAGHVRGARVPIAADAVVMTIRLSSEP